MEEISPIAILMRWLHITGAIVAAGGSIFALFAVAPALTGLEDGVRKELHENIRRRFARLFMAAVAALLVSGFYNYVTAEIPKHQGQGLYHGLMGGKIILAFGVFFLGSALLGRAKALEGIRRRRKRWMMLNVFLVLVIVALAAVLGKMSEATSAAP